jgi:hypothetical protein
MNFISKVFLTLFSSSVAAISIAGMLLLAQVNYGNTLYFSGLVFVGIPFLAFLQPKINYLFLGIFCSVLSSVFLLTFALTNIAGLQNILMSSKSSGTESNFFALFFLILCLVIGFGVIAMRKDRLSIAKNHQ